MKKIIPLLISVITITTLLGCDSTTKNKKDEYNFTFDVNYDGGNNRTDVIKAGSRATFWSARRSGYDLVDWYTSKDFVKPFDFYTPINDDITVYAKWTEKGETCTINFDYNYEGCVDAGSISGTKGKVLNESLMPNPYRVGYDVEGWYKEKECINKWNSETDLISGNMTLYANYVSNTNFKYDSNGKIIFEDVEFNLSVNVLSWHNKKSLVEIVDAFNDQYDGQIKVNFVNPFTNEVARIEQTEFVNQSYQNFYRMNELLDLVGLSFDENNYYESAIAENYIQGNLVTLPLGHIVPYVIYNKNLLSELNKEVPQTFQDFYDTLSLANTVFKDRENYLSSLVCDSEWEWIEIASNSIWTQAGVPFISYNKETKKYENNFAKSENQEKIKDAMKGLWKMMSSNSIIKPNVSSSWDNKHQPLQEVVNGNALIGLVNHPNIRGELKNGTKLTDKQLLNNIGLLPLSNFFNNGNYETGNQIFVKGVSLGLPHDAGEYDAYQLAAVGIFADFISKNGSRLAINDLYPASKISHTSEDFLTNENISYQYLRTIGNPANFATLPGHTNNYQLFNHQNATYINSIKALSNIEDQTLETLINSISRDINSLI